MGSRVAVAGWVVVYLLVACRTVSSTCPHPLRDAAPTASGYLAINQSSGSKMFFAYYEALQHIDDDGVPILLWLEGGPGCSGVIASFFQLGPWLLGEDLCLHRNPASWNRIFGLLFLDNPLGTGFSIAPLVEDIPTDEAGVARDVYIALEGFLDRFPALRDRPFYVTGESYAGKFVPAVATYILGKQGDQGTSSFPKRQSSNPLRLAGVAIGSGLTHPITQVAAHAPTAYFSGLIDENQKEEVDRLAAKAVAYVEEKNWVDAEAARAEVVEYIQNVTGLATLFDARGAVGLYNPANGTEYLTSFVNKEEFQVSLLNAGRHRVEICSGAVALRLLSDVMKSTKDMVESLLNQSVPVLLYQGQFDLQVGVVSNEAWIRLLRWEGIKSFYTSERKVWKENNVVVGYVRSYGSLTHVVVSNAGHLVAVDQPYASQRMIERWVSGVAIV